MMPTHHLTRPLAKFTPPRCVRQLCSTPSPRFAADGAGYPSALPASALRPAPPSQYKPSSSRQPDARTALAQRFLKEAYASETTSKAVLARRRQTLDDVERSNTIRDLERQQTRRWLPGDVYAPHDLSPVEMQKWKAYQRGGRDAFDVLGMNPLEEWKNVSILGGFLTPLGRIKHRKDTGLRAVNQRKVAKAIRRAVGMGLLPSVHPHPEILEDRERVRNERRFGLDGRKGIVLQ